MIWTGTLTAPVENLIALRNQMAKEVRQELVPALGITHAAAETTTTPSNQEGYDLYLRSVAMAHDGAANKEAIAILERAVALDSNYAPTWEALGGAITSMRFTRTEVRRDISARMPPTSARLRWSRDGSAPPDCWRRMKPRAEISTRPMTMPGTCTQASRMPRLRIIRWPMCCAMRGGWAKRRASATRQWPSMRGITTGVRARWPLLEAGKSARAMEYLNRDAGSEWSNAMRVAVLMRQGKMMEARQAVPQVTENPMWMRGLLQACLDKAPAADIQQLAEQAQSELLGET